MQEFDFDIIAKVLKKVRIEKGMTQTEAARKVGINLRYLQAIENSGKRPGFDIFYKLMTLFDLSVDTFFYPNKHSEKLSETMSRLSALSDNELIIIDFVIAGIENSRNK